jgi:hypothetical protein
MGPEAQVYGYSKINVIAKICTYKRFRGFMIKHHRVHIAPVAVNARFCVRERFSAGRQKSLTPARTSDHCSMPKIALN